MVNASVTPAVPRLAATVMLVRESLMRESLERGFEVWLAKRSLRSRFMPGASVFPGGAVDAADDGPEARAATLDAGEPGGFALRHAVLRETFEEAGLLLACAPNGDAAAVPPLGERREMRRAMHARERTLDAMLLERGLRLDARGLAPYSNWITPAVEPIRFDTHFFVAPAPGDHDAEADDAELHDGSWSTPARALSDADSGKIVLTFPTRAHVERLATFATADDLFAHARTRVVRPLEVAIGDVFDPVRFAQTTW